MKKEKGFMDIEIISVLTFIFAIVFFVSIVLFYKKPEYIIIDKIEWQRYLREDTEYCALKIRNLKFDHLPISECLFLNKDKEYIIRTNGKILIEIKEKD